MHTLLLQSLFPLLLITSFLSINVELSLSQDNEQYTNCGEDINCGGFRNISYPFWGVNRANYCGPKTYVTTNINFSLFDYTSGLTNLTFYYACNTSNIPGLNSSSQACNTNNTTVRYAMRSPPVDPVATRACKTGVSVPVFTTAALALKADRITIKEVVGRGFELGLQIDNVQCKSCVESGGKCGLNTTSRGFCFCLDEPYATTCNAK
ncbi:hypothetical protein PRUPE_3G146000, partial [Prunus persica]